MKTSKLGFAITAAAVALFVVGCATKTTPPAKYRVKHHAYYHSKLGKVSTRHDTKK